MAFALENAPFDDLRALIMKSPDADEEARVRARLRQEQIALPAGELGRLADLAIWMAGWQEGDAPHIDRPMVAVFASSHQIAAQGVSRYDAARAREMADAVLQGTGAVNQIAKAAGAGLKVFELALEEATPDITQNAALTERDCAAVMAYAMQVLEDKPDVLSIGVVGAGATTAAGAMALALYGGTPAFWAVAGSAVDDEDMLAAKAKIIGAAVDYHSGNLDDPLEVLRRVGGRDMAGAAGAILAARHQGVPVVLDGFATCAAAAVLHRINPAAVDHCVAGSVTPRDSHRAILDRLGKQPILDLGLGLGDGSGAALAINVLRAAIACHNDLGQAQPL
ncbi:MAG: nicotinate-nucleotide--dimethylbenzimidazole phosphoribosyltransferase [Robiginitomaculum sp.]|nr:MAG: nicotinate-nucleotide--dimethylbenzimidazole phosphoribosyltransferase [Robiginitomaculum sp.]